MFCCRLPVYPMTFPHHLISTKCMSLEACSQSRYSGGKGDKKVKSISLISRRLQCCIGDKHDVQDYNTRQNVVHLKLDSKCISEMQSLERWLLVERLEEKLEGELTLMQSQLTGCSHTKPPADPPAGHVLSNLLHIPATLSISVLYSTDT